MHLPKASILIPLLCYSPALGLVATSPSSIDGQPLPDRWYAYTDLDTRTDLDLLFEEPDGNQTDAALLPRTDVRVCERVLGAFNNGCGILASTYTFAFGMGTLIWAWSHNKDCSKHSGTIDGFRYEYYATGRNCDTTAQKETIAGAVNHYLRTVDHNKVCGTECLKLDHGGTWEGYLKIGKEGVFNSAAYCGPTLSFSHCASGGKNDI